MRFLMWLCAALSVFYFFGFTARAFIRFWRCGDRDWLWLMDLWSAIVVSTVLGTIALTIWMIASVPAAHPQRAPGLSVRRPTPSGSSGGHARDSQITRGLIAPDPDSFFGEIGTLIGISAALRLSQKLGGPGSTCRTAPTLPTR